MLCFGLFILGGVSLLVGFQVWQNRRTWLKNTATVLGTAQNFEVLYTHQGKTYKLKTKRRYSHNQGVSILFSLQNPSQARINSPFTIWFAPCFFMVVGLVCWGLALLG